MFPVPIGMASTWDTPLEHDVASAIADEGRAINNYWPTIAGPTAPSNNGQLLTRTADGDFRHNGLVYRSPVINISRHPLWGRIDEAFGEDPFLTSRMTVAFVKGTHGVRKARVADPGSTRGKSGSYRYLYLYLEHAGRIHLLYLFSKGEQADLSPQQKQIIGALSQEIRKER